MDRRANTQGTMATAAAVLALLALALGLLASGGCSSCRLPRIDPSGDHIFVPGSTTAVVAPTSGSNCLFGWGPRPAFVSPPDPPPCDFAYTDPADPCNAILGAPVPCPSDCPPIGGQVIVQPMSVTPGLVISPGSLISPVGSEVVLTAGINEKQGGFCKSGEKIEWMLSQDSVGSFIEIGDPGGNHFASFLHHAQPKKFSNNYAVGYATKQGERITRGTPNPADDVTVPVGHSWLTLTSATEGASHVTAFAPDAQGFERRQQTATVYWIDAQWAFPPPVIGRAGEKQVLNTMVTRSTNGSPLAGWIVRYELLGGPAVGFGTGGERVIEARTNPNGQATVEVFPTSREAGVTQIAISVIRPAGADGLQQTTVGQGATTITWSAPSIAVRVSGPEIAEVGSTVTYRIEVANPGDLVASQVTVTDVLDAALQYVSSSPAAQVLGDRLVWSVGDLAPKTQTTIELNCKAIGRGDIRHCANARTPDGLTAENCFVTRIFEKSLRLNLTGPQTAAVGENVTFGIEIRNQGTQIIRNVVVKDTFDAGLRHAEAASPISLPIGDIAPGQTITKGVTFQVVAPGQLCHNVEVSGEGEQTIVGRQCLTTAQRQAAPRLTLRHSATAASQVGQGAEYVVDVTNSGDVPLTNVRIAIALPQSVSPTNASANHTLQGNTLFWAIPRLEPNQSDRKQVQVACRAADPQACARASVQSDQTAAEAQDACVRIDAAAGGVNPNPNPGVPNPGVGAGPPPAADPAVITGTLNLEVSSAGEPVAFGGENTYYFTITNTRNVADKNVYLQVALPAGFTNPRPTSIRPLTVQANADQRELTIGPIAEMRPGDKEVITMKVAVPRQAGQYTLQAQVRSQRQPQPEVKQTRTTVNPAN